MDAHTQQPSNQPSWLDLRSFGKTGLQVSALGFGAAEIGYTNTSENDVDRMIGALVESGVNVIDTAAMYGDSEEKIGRALRGRRRHFHLFTKCGRSLPSQRTALGLLLRAQRRLRRWAGLVDDYESFDWRPHALEWSIDRSLRRLRTDTIDLIQLHSCSENILRKTEVVGVLQRAREAGKVRFLGYSGDGDAAMYAIRSGQFDAVQISVNIADQDAIDTTLCEAARLGMGVIAKRPLANSLWQRTQRPDPEKYPQYQAYWERLRQLHYSFLEGNSGLETALRFTLSVPGVHIAIPGTTNSKHVLENAAYAAAGRLPKSLFDAIRSRWLQVAEPGWAGQV